MSESNIEDLMYDYLDLVYVISYSKPSVCVYRSGANHFEKFTQMKNLE